MDGLLGWLNKFISWLQNNLGSTHNLPSLEHHVSPDSLCELWLLADDRTDPAPLPGLASLWYLRHHTSASSDLLIVLVNIAQARGLRSEDIDFGRLPKHWQRTFEFQVKKAIREQLKEVSASHIFLVGWIEKIARTRTVILNAKPVVERYFSIECTACYAIDLQSMEAAWVGQNEPARKVVKAVAMRALLIEPGQYNTWEELLYNMSDLRRKTNWLTWLEFFAKDHPPTRINGLAALQPRRVRFEKKREDP